MLRRGRQSFKPPKPKRRSSFRMARSSQDVTQWRYWSVSGISRVVYGFGFLLVPSLVLRLGDAALVSICVVLGTTAGCIAGLSWHYSGGTIRRDLVADVVTLFLVVPVVAVAVSIQVADVRFGGRGGHFLAAAVAVGFAYLIVVIIATFAGSIRDQAAQIAVLPSALVIAAVIGGAGKFSSSNTWKGVSLAWMLAAAGTVLFGVLPHRLRGYIASGVYIVFGTIILITSNSADGESIVAATSAGLATLLTVVVGVILVGIPLFATDRRPSNRNLSTVPGERLPTDVNRR